MEVAHNVEILEIPSIHGILNLVLVWDNYNVVLIDIGLPGQIDLIEEAVAKAGCTLSNITKVILTHQDIDHIGNAKVLQKMGKEILAHELDTPYLEGQKTPIRLADLEARLNNLSAEEQSKLEYSKQTVPNLFVRVNKTLKDLEILKLCGGIQAIHTPGHMLGHIALLLQESNIIVTGDVANVVDGKLTGANPQYTKAENMAEATKSFNRMLSMQPDALICYHGGFFKIK